VPVGQVQQVPQPAAAAVPPLVTDAVLQHHVVGPGGPQDAVDFLRGLAGVHLIHLHTHTRRIEADLCWSVRIFDCSPLPPPS